MPTRTQEKRGSGCTRPKPWTPSTIAIASSPASSSTATAAALPITFCATRSGPSASAFPASDVLHVFRADAPGQVRGVSWFAPIILRLHDYDKAADALGMRLQIAAMLCGFVTNPNAEVPQFAEGVADGTGALLDGLEPGVLKTLAPGEDVRWSDPPDLGAESIQFLTLTAREIASGSGAPLRVVERRPLAGELFEHPRRTRRVAPAL